MSEEIVPFEFESHQVRTVVVDGEPWFVAHDIAKVLGYRSAPDMTRRLEESDKGYAKVRTPGGEQEVSILNESGLYDAIFRSNADGARPFRMWVTREVLPQIRRTGSYHTPLSDEEIVAQALQITTKRVEQLEAKVKADAPAVEYVERFVAQDDDAVTVRDAAKALNVRESDLRQCLQDWQWVYRQKNGARWSDSQQRMVEEYEWRAYADHAGKFILRPQHNAPRHHNGQVRQTLYLKAFVLPDLQKRVEASWRS